MADVQNIQVIDSSKKVRKTKKVPKEGPAKYKSSYLHYCIMERTKVVQEHPDIKNTEIVTEIAKRWNDIKKSPELLKKFEDLAALDKERYTREMESWVKPVVPEIPVADSSAPAPAAKKKRASKKAAEVVAAPEAAAPTPVVEPVQAPVVAEEEELLEEEVAAPVVEPPKKVVKKKVAAKK
jgi:hypothetical protein